MNRQAGERDDRAEIAADGLADWFTAEQRLASSAAWTKRCQLKDT